MSKENNFSEDYKNYLKKTLNIIKEKVDLIMGFIVKIENEMKKYIKNSLQSALDFKVNIVNCLIWLDSIKTNSNDNIEYIKTKEEFIQNIKNTFQKCKINSLFITQNIYIQNINKVNGNIYELLFDIADFKFNPPNINSINDLNSISNNISINVSNIISNNISMNNKSFGFNIFLFRQNNCSKKI